MFFENDLILTNVSIFQFDENNRQTGSPFEMIRKLEKTDSINSLVDKQLPAVSTPSQPKPPLDSKQSKKQKQIQQVDSRRDSVTLDRKTSDAKLKDNNPKKNKKGSIGIDKAPFKEQQKRKMKPENAQVLHRKPAQKPVPLFSHLRKMMIDISAI